MAEIAASFILALALTSPALVMLALSEIVRCK